MLQQSVHSASDPSALYAAPQDVLRDSTLSQSHKRDVLRRWALDVYLIELAQSDTAPTTSRLDAVIDALIALDDTELRRFMDRIKTTPDPVGQGAQP